MGVFTLGGIRFAIPPGVSALVIGGIITFATVILAVPTVALLIVAVMVTSLTAWLAAVGVIVTVAIVPSVRLSEVGLRVTRPAGVAVRVIGVAVHDGPECSVI